MPQQKASPYLDRRGFLLASGAAALVANPLSTAQAEENGILLQPGKQNLYRVRMEVVMKGNVHVPSTSRAARGKPLKLPIDSKASFDFEERLHFQPSDHSPKGAAEPTTKGFTRQLATSAERYYHLAKAQSMLNSKPHAIELRDPVRDTMVRNGSHPERISAFDDFFKRDELELLRTPASSMAIDQLLPTARVKVGSKYSVSSKSMASILNLDAAMDCELQAEVMSIDDDEVKIQLRGKIDGAVEGVPTIIRTVGKLTFDRKFKTCTWLAMGLHETREIGQAEPGFDVSATVQLMRQPLKAVIALPENARTPKPGLPTGVDQQYVTIPSEKLGFEVVMDRRWRMMRDRTGSVMMRMVENDRTLCQCDIYAMTTPEGEQPWSLATFEANARILLGDQFTEIAESDEHQSDSGTRILTTIANGSAEGVPVRWIMMHLSSPNVDPIVATFTMEASNIDAFGSSDMQFANSIQFRSDSAVISPQGEQEESAQSGKISNRDDLSQNPGINAATPKQATDSISNANRVR